MFPLSKMEWRLLTMFNGSRQTFRVQYCPYEGNPGTFSASDYRAFALRLHHCDPDLKAAFAKEILWPRLLHPKPPSTLLLTLDRKSLDCAPHESVSAFSWRRLLKK